MGALWWRLTVRGPGTDNPVPADSCYTVAQAAAAVGQHPEQGEQPG